MLWDRIITAAEFAVVVSVAVGVYLWSPESDGFWWWVGWFVPLVCFFDGSRVIWRAVKSGVIPRLTN